MDYIYNIGDKVVIGKEECTIVDRCNINYINKYICTNDNRKVEIFIDERNIKPL